MTVAYLQSKSYMKASLENVRPNLGILFLDFFYFYGSLKFEKLEIHPKISYLPIDELPVRSRSNSNQYTHPNYNNQLFKVLDPFKETSNLAKKSLKYLYLESLFSCIYVTMQQETTTVTVLERVFQTAKLYQTLSRT